jgi:hypothetical protein
MRMYTTLPRDMGNRNAKTSDHSVKNHISYAYMSSFLSKNPLTLPMNKISAASPAAVANQIEAKQRKTWSDMSTIAIR